MFIYLPSRIANASLGNTLVIASDDDFFVLRRFSELSSRILLALQDELSELEGQLDAHEKELTTKSALNRHNGTFREEFSEIRLDLCTRLTENYARTMSSYCSIRSFALDLQCRAKIGGASRIGSRITRMPLLQQKQNMFSTLKICSPSFLKARLRSVASWSALGTFASFAGG
jgi:hypothetical protein